MTSRADIIEQHRQRYAGTFDSIRNDKTRTEGWKREQLAVRYLELKRDVDAALAAHERDAATRRRAAERKVFGIESIPGDRASLAISRRDAGDRAAKLTTAADALALLARAERSGDEPLARAIAEHAMDSGWVDVANAFLDTRPHLDADYSDLWNQTSRTVTGEVEEAFTYGTLKPRELDSVNEYQLPVLAEGSAQATA